MNMDVIAGGMFGMASRPFVDIIGGTLNSYLDSALLPFKYDANFHQLTSLPSVQDAFSAYINGYMSEVAFQNIQAYNNVAPKGANGTPFASFGAKTWQMVFDSKIPQLNIEQIIFALNTKYLTKERATELLKKYGFRGSQIDILKYLLQPKFDGTTNVANYYRGFWERPKVEDHIKRTYGCDVNDAKDIINSTQFLPPPSDLIRMSVRDAFTNNVELQKELDSEYDEQKDILPWAKAQGILVDAMIKENGITKTLDVLRMYWRSHWQLMSPTQGYEGLHRIRNADRVKRYPLVKDLTPFTFDKLEQLLKMSDYLPSQRKVLAAISYKVIGRVDLRRLYNTDVIKDDEMKEQILDQGYNQEDAKLLSTWMKQEKDKAKEKEDEKKQLQSWGKLIEEIYKGYNIGAVNKTDAYNGLLSYGVDPDVANGRLMAIDFAINRKRVETLIQMIKGEFFLGLYDGLQAYAELVQGGLTDIRANQYVIRWQRQLSRPRRLVSINAIIDWLKRGLISFIDAKKRLSNLGLSNEDTLLYVEMARMDIQKAINIEQAKQAKTEQQKADEAKRLEKEARANKKAAISDLKSYSSISQIGKWIQSGLLDIESATERMRFMEVPETDIARYLLEWSE